MIVDKLKTKLGSALAIAAVVASVGGIASVSAAQVSSNNAKPAAGYGKDQCKNGGWKLFKAPDGSQLFKNQGQCVAFFAHGGNGGNSSNNENNVNQNTTVNQNVTSGDADNGASSGNVSASSTVNNSSTVNSSTSN